MDYDAIYKALYDAAYRAILATGDAYKNLSWFNKNKPEAKISKVCSESKKAA